MRRTGTRVAIASCAVLLSAGACTERGGSSEDFRSPSGAYLARLSGNLPAPKLPFRERITDLTVSRAEVHGWREIQRIELFRADMLDDGFADRYGAPAWIADNVLRFAWQGYKRDGVLDGLTIRNDSAKRVGYVKLSALDLIVAFDLPPASETVLRTTAQFVTDEPFIAVEGAFDDGTSIRAASRHFQTVASGSTEYVITITPQATATIERQTPNRTPARQP